MRAHLFVLFAACGGGAPLTQEELADLVDDCRADYPPEEGYGWDSDFLVDPGEIQAACEDAGGTDCEADGYLTREAAYCVGIGVGLEEEALSYDQHLELWDADPSWHIHALLHRDGSLDRFHGVAMHATTGEILDDDRWTVDTSQPTVSTSG